MIGVPVSGIDFAFDRCAAGRHLDDLAHGLAAVGGDKYATAKVDRYPAKAATFGARLLEDRIFRLQRQTMGAHAAGTPNMRNDASLRHLGQQAVTGGTGR